MIRDDTGRIRALVEAYASAYEAHDARVCADIFTGDALVVSPWGPPTRGTEAIAATHLDWFAEGERNKEMTVEDLVIDGDLAFCLLRFAADVPAGRSNGVSLNSLRRQSDGGWRISHCCLCELDGPLAAGGE